MRIGIALRLNLIVLIAVLALGATLGAFFVGEQRKILDGELDQRIEIVGRDIAPEVEDVLAKNDIDTLNRILQAGSQNREIAYLIVKSPSGDIKAARWAEQTRGAIAEYSFPLYATPLHDGGDRVTELFGEGPHKAQAGREAIGQLAIGVDMSGRHAALRRVARRIILAVALGAVLAMMVGVVFVSLLLRTSITPLLAGIRGVGGGDLSQRVRLRRKDEIGEIGGAFNDMADKLSATLVSKQDLEATVSRRTAEVKEALDQRIRDERIVAEREESIRLLLNSTAEAIIGVDTAGICTFCNPACVRILGFERAEDIVGKNLHRLIHHTKPDGSPYPDEECPLYAVAREGKGYHSQAEMMWKADGARMQVECWSYPILRGSTVAGAVVTFLDITDRIDLEQRLVQAQKLEGIGILAGGIAHDFNNLLTPILGYTEMTLQNLGEGHPAGKNLKIVLESARRASDITRQILAFSRKQILDTKVLDLNETVAAAAKLLRRLIGEDIEVRLELAADLPCVKADPSQMQQVLINLAVNARDAMPAGGTLTIQTSKTESDVSASWHTKDLPPGQYAVLSVSDNGIGMDERTRQRIFEPFFTTKEVGKGTGLGLSTVHGIVRQHGGNISVYSEPGRGATFRIYLPCIHEAPEIEGAATPSPAAKGCGRILLVEDDDAVRDLTEAMLTAHGYTVTSVARVTDALAEAARAAFDLLVSDVIMPGMNGPDLYRNIADIAPGLKVLYMSGYPADSGSLTNVLEGGEQFIHKPFTAAELMEKIRQAMNAAG